MIFPASLWVMSQAVAIHLSLVITCFIFLNLILIPYFIAVAQTYGMPSTSVQGMRYSTPAPSPSTAHKFPVSAPIIAQSVHQRYQHQGMSSTSVHHLRPLYINYPEVHLSFLSQRTKVCRHQCR
jgi:hypothetical protein